MAKQLERKAFSQDFSNSNSQNQQFRQGNAVEKSYNSEEHHQVYHSTQQSFNEQREQYTEQAFNSYDYVGNSGPPPPDPPSGVTDEVGLYDSALEKLYKKRAITIQKEENLYDSIETYTGTNVIKANGYIDEREEKSKKIQRLLKEKKGKKYVISSKNAVDGRLLIQYTERRLSKREFDRNENTKKYKKYAEDIAKEKVGKKTRLLFDDKNIQEDDNSATSMKNTLKTGAKRGRLLTRRNIRKIKEKANKYARLKNAVDKEKLLNEQINQRLNQNAYRRARDVAKAEKNKLERKKKMQKARIQRRAQEGNFFRRTWHNFKLKKKSVEQKTKTAKNVASIAVAVGFIVFILMFLVLFIFTFGMAIFQGSAESYIQTVVQVDYTVMSDCTAYYRKLETDLEEKLADTETLESEIMAEYGDDIYEFVYNIADIGFDSTTLVAYLGAKFVEFTFEDVQAELDELFSLNYNLIIETKMEYREEAGAEVKICYITLEKIPLEDIVVSRMTKAELVQYQIYKLSTGGQQIYGPVMTLDWTNLITSNYGERIHPITKERTMHNGVDIGIPTGTPLYSAIDGSVTCAQYSDTAGYYLKVQSKSGWTVVFMHMDSIAVADGDSVKKGDFVGYSGNTGRSTGPHLHLEVRDADNNPLNPIFIIPQNCVVADEEE